ncbi:hypothetical protein AMEX_G5526 [Astyanax mexicanus]|uniref:Uncharacterized protein n=1 Tax=Astyanax mexicanus TaxID=7994 RepID=A0A8T2M9P3_ASTMX|nr:hypothetical protein AMEX_G5526 [Astyanax mexicanus]
MIRCWSSSHDHVAGRFPHFFSCFPTGPSPPPLVKHKLERESGCSPLGGCSDRSFMKAPSGPRKPPLPQL